MMKNKVGNENDRGITMSGVKRICKTAGKIAFCIVLGVGLIGFVKGLFVGYLICHYKDKCSLHNIKYTDTV
jgi:hypothetical protein